VKSNQSLLDVFFFNKKIFKGLNKKCKEKKRKEIGAQIGANGLKHKAGINS